MNPLGEPYAGSPAPPEPTETMWIDTTVLYAAAHEWEWDVSQALRAASDAVAEGEGIGRLFGRVFAPAGAAHDDFAANAVTQLRVGSAEAERVGTAVRATVDDWVRTDDGAAEKQHRAVNDR
ncbi:hypothetical protein [Nocardioides litoris]|uniref:hypothetical protein n=1 Tax=Nocardioides litoris TaxID=1926648 RepID=UPI001122D4F5|nr:hypothetical protein [Nocardioides litoris]